MAQFSPAESGCLPGPLSDGIQAELCPQACEVPAYLPRRCSRDHLFLWEEDLAGAQSAVAVIPATDGPSLSYKIMTTASTANSWSPYAQQVSSLGESVCTECQYLGNLQGKYSCLTSPLPLPTVPILLPTLLVHALCCYTSSSFSSSWWLGGGDILRHGTMTPLSSLALPSPSKQRRQGACFRLKDLCGSLREAGDN